MVGLPDDSFLPIRLSHNRVDRAFASFWQPIWATSATSGLPTYQALADVEGRIHWRRKYGKTLQGNNTAAQTYEEFVHDVRRMVDRLASR